MKLLAKIPVLNRFAEDEKDSQTRVWRRRSSSWMPDPHKAARYIFDNRPNAHILDTDEEIPAIPLKNIYPQKDGTNYFEVAEVEDGQYAPTKSKLEDALKDADLDINEEAMHELLDNYEEDGGHVPLKPVFDTEQVKKAVIDNKDQRLNFWLDHLKESEEKYDAGGLLKEHMNLILIIVTALAIGIIMYTSPIGSEEFMQILGQLVEVMQNLNTNLETLLQENPGLAEGAE